MEIGKTLNVQAKVSATMSPVRAHVAPDFKVVMGPLRLRLGIEATVVTLPRPQQRVTSTMSYSTSVTVVPLFKVAYARQKIRRWLVVAAVQQQQTHSGTVGLSAKQ
jgi:hypothetical protein